MSKVAMAVLVTLCINLMLFFSQIAIEELNPSARVFDRSSTLLNAPDQGGGVIGEDAQNILPSSGSSVSATTGNIFTDTFTSIKGWLLDDFGGKYFVGFLFAVPNFLKAMGLPESFAFGLSSLWYGYTVVLVLLLLWGDRN
jgi:hypothetical protein